MLEFGYEPDIVSYGLFSLSCKTQSEAREYFEKMNEVCFTPNLLIMHAMLKNACAAGDINFEIEILRTMKQLNIEPDKECLLLVKNAGEESSRRLRKCSHLNKTERNECFKVIRERKDWMKHFRLDQIEHKKRIP